MHHTHLFFHHLMIVIKALCVGVLQQASSAFIIVMYNFFPWWKFFTYKKISNANVRYHDNRVFYAAPRKIWHRWQNFIHIR